MQYPTRSIRYRTVFHLAGVLGLTLALSYSAHAQQTVNVWPGIAPGSENWKQTERTVKNTPMQTVIFNVVKPTLTVFLPEKGKANGTGIIVAPGGACIALAIDYEGLDVAHWLQQRGFATFVLKYRLMEKKGEGIPADLNEDEACKYGMQDAIQAVKVVRQHAAEWDISSERLGFIGFSAGAMVGSAATLQTDSAARPNFTAFIYGGPFGAMPQIPPKLPPIFMAWAQDDDIAAGTMTRFYQALRAAGNKPEAHIYSAGGHGFASKKQGPSSVHWKEEFYYWLQAEGFAKRGK